MSNQKQIGLGLLQYAQDYDERLPASGVCLGASFTNCHSWHEMTQPYLKSIQIFVCPSNTNANMGFNNISGETPISADYAGVATGNATGAGTNGFFQSSSAPGTALSSINNPATTLAVMEANTNNGASWQFDITDAAGNSTPANSLFAGHLSTSNYLFADGHVKSLRPTATIDSSAGGSSALNMWALDNKPFSGTAATAAQAQIQAATNTYK